MKRLGLGKRKNVETGTSNINEVAVRDTSQTTPLSSEHLKEVLAIHKKWIASARSEREKANLEGADLRGAELEGVDLRAANLDGANLRDAKLDKANLQEASLRGADLRGASLVGANLLNANFREALLDNANLTNAEGLLDGQFAGASLSNAKLPEIVAKFEAIAIVDETSKVIQNLFLTVLVVCLYSWLTIATTVDHRLIGNSASSPLPIIGASIPIVTFYTVAPLILMVLYLHFNIYLQRLWEGLSELPAIFPDGRTLDNRISPWLLNGFVRSSLKLLKGKSLPLAALQKWTSLLLAWWLVPLTLFLFWLRYLSAHDIRKTSLHVFLVAVSIGAGFTLHRLASATLRGKERAPFRWKEAWRSARVLNYAIGLIVLLVFLLLSFEIVRGVRSDERFHSEIIRALPNGLLEREDRLQPELAATNLERWCPRILSYLGSSPFADFSNQEISTKPANWSGMKDEEIDFVKGAQFASKNLRYILAFNAFLVKADLSHCNLERGDFDGADMRKANLRGARLCWASLISVNLGKSDLVDADLRGAAIWRTDMSSANLTAADLQGAILLEVNLSGAILNYANMRGASVRDTNLSGADVRAANMSAIDLSDVDLNSVDLAYVNLSSSDLRRAKLIGANFERTNLLKTDLRGADLRAATNLTSEQIKEAIIDGSTALPKDL